jgi:protein arginine N-methyltransferase 1
MHPSAADLRAFREDLESRLAPVSVRARQDAIVRFFAHLVERGVLERSPVPEGWRVKARYQAPDISMLLSPGDLARIASAADEIGGAVACVVRLILEAGLRGGEIEQADVGDLITARGEAVLLVRPQRGGTPRRHRLAQRTAELLRGEVGGRTSGPLLRTPSGRRLSQRSLQRLLDPVVEAAGVTDRVTPGALRMAAMRRHLELGELSRPVEDMVPEDAATSPMAATRTPAAASARTASIAQGRSGSSPATRRPSLPVAHLVPADQGEGPLYRRGEHLVLELDGGSVYLRGADGLHPLGRHGLAVLDAFAAPRTLGDVADELGALATSAAEWSQATASLLRLIELGALEPVAGPAPRQLRERGAFADPFAHVAMLDDHRRTGSFLRALDEVVSEGATVCDLGTGTGVLAVAAALRGAGHVFAIDALTGDWARRLARSNGVEGIVTVMEGWSTDLELPQRADVLVTETISDDPPGERILETVIDARRRLLTSDAMIVPAQLRICAVPVQLPERVLRQHRFTAGNTSDWSAAHGQDFSALAEVQPPVGPKAVHPTRTAGWQALTGPTVVAEIDLRTVTSPVIKGRQRARAMRAGRVDAVVVYFAAQLTATVELAVHWDERLGARTWSWSYAVWLLEAPIEVRRDDLLELGYCYRVPGRAAARRASCSLVQE